MKLQNWMEGLTLSQPQRVGNMTVIPLVVEEPTDNFPEVGGMSELTLVSDPSYDSLVLGSTSDVGIAPMGTTVITKQSAQDRTVPSAHLFKGEKKVNAFCVQSSQGGLMSRDRSDDRQWRLLPAGIRMIALGRRNAGGYSELWGSLRTWNQSLGLSGDYLSTFYDRFKGELEQFVAEFEPVPNQRGALVLINSALIGIEVMPSVGSFSDYFDPLIRDCYGSQAIYSQREATANDATAGFLSQILQGVDSLTGLADAVDQADEAEVEWAGNLLSEVVDEEIVLEPDEQAVDGYKLNTITTNVFNGQVVTKDNKIVYATLLRKPQTA